MNQPTNDIPTASGGSRWGLILQVLGFGIGIVLLGWAVRLAMQEENRAQIAKLTHATPGEMLVLLGLAAASVGLNGIIFWAVIYPVHKARCTDVIATNAIATFLAYLPFKLSVVCRFVIHNRRDRIPVLTIGAWLIAMALLMLAVFGPLILVSIAIHEVNTLWWISTLTLILICTGLGSVLSRFLAGQRGAERLAKIPLLGRHTERDSFKRLHTGIEMLANPRTAFLANGLRILDILTFALTFYVAAQVLDMPLTMSDSVLLGGTYFIIGAAAPSGMLGTREAGTIGFAQLIGISGIALTETSTGDVPIAATVLFVTAVEGIVNLGCAGFGIAWLRARPGLEQSAPDPPIESTISGDGGNE